MLPHNLFDLSVKTLVRRSPAALFRLAGVAAGPQAIEAVDSAVVMRELRADQVFVHRGDEAGAWALYAEYQYEPEPKQVRGWLQKALALEEQLELPVVLLVLYLHRGDRATFPDRHEVRGGGLANTHTFATVRLWEHAARIRSGELVELAPLLVLCEDRPAEAVVQEERELIDRAGLPRPVQAELLGLAYLLGLRYLTRGTLDAVFGEELPMLKEAGIISDWIEEARAAAATEGLERGLAEGRAEGRAEEARRLALLILRSRFVELPEQLVARVKAMDADGCEALVQRALRVEALDELEE